MADKAKAQAPTLKVTHFPNHYPASFMNSPDTLWLRVTPKSFLPDINVQKGVNQGSKSGVSLYFLLQKSFSFGVDHEWEDLTTLAGGIREVKAGFENAANQLSGFVGANVANAYAAGKTKKNDNPYIYKNSQRRKVSIELKFGTKFSAEDEVWNPIQSLILWSCADKIGGRFDTTVNFPFVFKLQTVTGDGREVGLISLSDACIDSVMPTYNEPYKNGYPMSAQVTVGFTDINPTYRSSILSGSKGTITTGTERSYSGSSGTREPYVSETQEGLRR